jgi:hypothetical protein
MRKLALLVAAFGLCAVAPRADTFLMKDGTQYEGTVVEEGDVLVITTYAGQVVRVKKADVMGWRKDPRRNEYQARLKALKPGDAPGHFALGQWAAEQGLRQEAREQYRSALEADPNHAAAAKALGYVQKDGRWAPAVEQGGLTIGATKPAAVDTRTEMEEARKLAARLETVAVVEDEQWVRQAEGQELVALAREQPGVVTRVLKPPNVYGSANATDALVRAKAAHLLGLAGDRRAMQPLLDACFDDQDDRVRLAAAKALAKLDEPVALRKLVDVAISLRHTWPTRCRACAAIRRYGDVEAVERLLAELSFELAGGNARDPKNPIRGSPGGLGSENPLSLDSGRPVVASGPHDEPTLYPVLAALKEVTGVTFKDSERDFKTWKNWWKGNQAKFRFKD